MSDKSISFYRTDRRDPSRAVIHPLASCNPSILYLIHWLILQEALKKCGYRIIIFVVVNKQMVCCRNCALPIEGIVRPNTRICIVLTKPTGAVSKKLHQSSLP